MRLIIHDHNVLQLDLNQVNIRLMSYDFDIANKYSENRMSIKIERALLDKYDISAPRYTSYPTAPYFYEGFTEKHYIQHATESNEALMPRDLSIYVHIPFCHSLCYFCGCNKVITSSNNDKVETYVESLLKEIELKSKLFDNDRKVTQIHFGGGTPNFLSNERLSDIIEHISSHFHLSVPSKLEISIEVDPRVIDASDIKKLSEIGFNRFSIGVQDFSEPVQRAVNRLQSEQKTLDVIQAACAVSDSVNVDLITGLPRQNVETFALTLEKIIASGATRIAAYNFAYLPQRIKAQRLIDASSLPSITQRLELVQVTRDMLEQAGFEHIGMDHFAAKSDSLAVAYQNDTLQRNFQGYTTNKNTDLLGFGVSAISNFKNAYAKNVDTISDYQNSLNTNTLAISRGYKLSNDDILRAELIQQIMCQASIDMTQTLNHFIDANDFRRFKDYFVNELQQLTPFVQDNLITLTSKGFKITEQGHFFRRQIASIFDSFFKQDSNNTDARGNVVQFSKAM